MTLPWLGEYQRAKWSLKRFRQGHLATFGSRPQSGAGAYARQTMILISSQKSHGDGARSGAGDHHWSALLASRQVACEVCYSTVTLERLHAIRDGTFRLQRPSFHNPIDFPSTDKSPFDASSSSSAEHAILRVYYW